MTMGLIKKNGQRLTGIGEYVYGRWKKKGKRQILMQSDTKLLQPFVSWSNSL